jgi:cytochrome c oxidase subunit III
MNTVSQQQPFNQSRIHPHKFALWVGVAGIIMMFAALTSAYVVRRAAGNWYEFRLPDIFWFNTAVILLSSLTIHFSYDAFKKGLEKRYKMLMLTTFVLGFAFVILQYKGWQALDAMGATFTINPSSSFIYVISGLHAAHVLGGIAALTVALAHAYYLPFKPTLRRRQRFDLVVTYWHFVDILWVYLMVFFAMQS